ncbi:MAG: HNH endonuclease [Bacteroidales bacterium]|nr:HNH endonuclease [Bacteroidales bacterium]
MSKTPKIDTLTAKKRNQAISDLKKQGFRRIPETDIFINEQGQTMIYPKNQPESRARLTLNGKTIIIEKVVLWIFKGEPIRGGKIVHIDGNTANNSPENLKYRTLEALTLENVNRAQLLTAIRYYFSVKKTFKARTNDYQTRFYLKEIIQKRNRYNASPTKTETIFFDWCYCWTTDPTTNKQISEKYDLTQLEAKTLIAKQVNQFSAAIIQEFEANKLEVLPYFKPKRKPNKPAYLPKSIRKAFKELGLKPTPRPDWKRIAHKEKPSFWEKQRIWIGEAIRDLNRAQYETTDPNRAQRIETALQTAKAEFQETIKQQEIKLL